MTTMNLGEGYMGALYPILRTFLEILSYFKIECFLNYSKDEIKKGIGRISVAKC